MKRTDDISDRLGRLEKEVVRWKTVAMMIACFTLVLAVMAAYLGAQAKTVPWVIEVTEEGNATYYPDAVKLLYDWTPNDTTQRYFIMKYVQNLRGISTDNYVNSNNILDVYNKTTGTGGNQIQDWYYNQSNPITRSANVYVTVPSEDMAITAYGDGKWKVTWRETTYRRSDRAIVADEQYEGIFNVAFYTPTTEREKRDNPLGLYITGYDISLLKNLM